MTQNHGQYLTSVLDQLADLVAEVEPSRYGAPTPCPEFDVAVLRNHILAWAQFFAASFEHPDGSGERPDVDGYEAPASPAEAADVLRDASRRIAACVAAGVADQPVTMFGGAMPGSMSLGMCLGEYVVHGHDLALATGLAWDPPAEAVAAALDFLPSMLTDEYRGPDQSFGYAVEVPATAPALDRIVALSGRDPYWKAP
ncbi:TIGR03086 family metal-binding protein [Kineosporia mesophila]|uniref:TIGR03086 family metal-binding protein n=1 Tax=Kineosporia mesophila TaxID=566012 RepID=A0ABP6YW93_9ACTN|nr:TIGR03086 family metal-binding protein [Kineosporia mesophila]MCD5354345.1 TIGR03086 family metal-binding protein [Kineosporia mesophila]